MKPRRSALGHLDPAPVFGREAELAFLDGALSAGPAAVWVHGPLGIGRSTLVRDWVESTQAPILWIDGELLPPSPEVLQQALSRVAESAAPIVVVDNVEALGALTAWLQREGLRKLPTDARLVVIAKRPPDARWLTLPDLPPLRTLALRQLSRQAAEAMLADAGLPPASAERLAALTHGHPLLLRMVARHPDVATSQLEHLMDDWIALLVGDLPDAATETALAVGSFARCLDFDLLTPLCGGADAAKRAVAHLDALGLTEAGPLGPMLHPLLRDLVRRDLDRRRPAWRDELFEHIRQSMVDRLLDRRTTDRGALLTELLWLVKDAPQMRIVFEGFAELGWLLDVPRHDEWPEIEALTAELEGPDEAARLRAWRQGGQTRTTVVRDLDGRWLGFVTFVYLTAPFTSPPVDDPVLATLMDEVERTGGARPGEVVQGARFWGSRAEGWDASAVQARIFLHISEQAFLTPNQLVLAGVDDPRQDRMQAASTFSVRVLARYETLGRARIWIGYHWREVSRRTWLDEGTRVVHGMPAGPAPSTFTAPLIALSEPAFADEVRRVLRSARDSTRWAGSPLLHSRLIVDRLTAGDSPVDRRRVLADVLHTAMAELGDADGLDSRLLAAAWLTTPKRKQAALAAEFGMAYSTFRLRLRRAETRLISALWQREMGA
jgi:hypothetical protein